MSDPYRNSFLLSALAVALTAAVPHSMAQTPPGAAPIPLIERAKFFGNPSKTSGRISPDGRWLSFIAPRDGVLNVWVAPLHNPEQARPLTDEKRRPIRQSFWAPDSKTVLFLKDEAGDENYLLYGADLASGEVRGFTPFTKTRVLMAGSSPLVKDRVLIGVNHRDPKLHDIYSLEPATGKLTLLMQNDGYRRFLADAQLNLRLAVKSRPDGGADYFRITDGKVEATPLTRVGFEDVQTTQPLTFSADGTTLYWADARGRDTSALLAQDLATGRTTVVAQDRRADIDSAMFDPRTGRLQAYEINHLKAGYVAVDPALKDDLAFLERETGGSFTISSRSDADDLWLVALDRVTEPPTVSLYDRKRRQLTPLYETRPELRGAPLAAMQALEIKARDGLSLVSYLTLPKDSNATPEGRARKPVPMVLFVHGGPWSRDEYGYHPYHQWLASRGYAVLSVNFRGSTGFGKRFINAGDQQWGRKMQDDLLDAVAWAVAQGVTTPDKVAIMGGSYGGYATLAGLAFTPKVFACGVDIVGPSNLFTLLKSIPAYWEEGKRQLYRRMGDPETETGRALLKERSPLASADKIERPLLIAQGANDPRVNIAESDQIVDAMKTKNIPVTYVVFPDEGHGFRRPVNNIAFNAVAENFLAGCLGGRAEPIGTTLNASTAQVRHGADYAPGLKEAMGSGKP